jgi:Arc/MetJ-type ribon-helix-helix transcriptional regulator
VNVNLTPVLERCLRDEIRRGRYASEDEALNDAVRLLGAAEWWALLADTATEIPACRSMWSRE